MTKTPPAASRTLRIPFVRRCSLISDQNEQPGMVLDLSLTGIYVQTEVLPKEGDVLTITFRVPGNDRLLNIKGIVVWINLNQAHPVHSLPPGFGFSFLAATPQDAALIAQTIVTYCRSNPLYQQYL